MHDDPLRIALLTHSVNPRGGVVHTLELARALHEAGHEVCVFAPAAPGQGFFREVAHRVELVRLHVVPIDTRAMVATRIDAYVDHLAALLQQERFDVLHAQDSISGNALATLQERGVVDGFVRTVHHLDTYADPQLAAWQQRAHEAADTLLCVSQVWSDTMLRDHGRHAPVAPNGVDLQRYTPRRDATDAPLASRFGLRAEGPLVLAIGGIEGRKNTHRLLEAFLRMRRDRPAAQLVIAGGASLLDHDDTQRRFNDCLRNANITAGPGEAVVVTGPLADADMPALFRAADVLALPSLAEGFGLVVLEALASGTPVVVSRLAPFTEYLTDAEADFADPLDVDSIARALQAALHPARRSALERAVPEVCQRYSWRASAERHVALYRARRALARDLGRHAA